MAQCDRRVSEPNPLEVLVEVHSVFWPPLLCGGLIGLIRSFHCDLAPLFFSNPNPPTVLSHILVLLQWALGVFQHAEEVSTPGPLHVLRALSELLDTAVCTWPLPVLHAGPLGSCSL